VLVEMTDHLLPPFDDSLRRYTLQELIKRGVDVRLNTAITEIERIASTSRTVPRCRSILSSGQRVSGDPRVRIGDCRSAGRADRDQ
jgi:NADH dehydrogenase